MTLYAFNFQFFSTAFIIIGIYVFLRRKDNVGNYYLAFSMLVAGWGYHMSELMYDHGDYYVLLYAARIGQFNAVLIPLAWLSFVQAFVGKYEALKRSRHVLALVSLFLAGISMTPLFITSMEPKCGYPYYPKPGVLYHLFPVTFFSAVAYAFYLLIRGYRAASDAHLKKQFKYLFLASLFGFVFGSTAFAVVYRIPAPKWLFLPIVLHPFILGYAITNFGLFDREAFIAAAHRLKLMALGIYSASINHEIKNPVYIAKSASESFLENVSENSYQAKDKEALLGDAERVCRQNVTQLTRISEIMDRLSGFVREGNYGASKRESRANVSEIFETVLRFIVSAHPNKQVEIERRFAPDLPAVTIDGRELEEIFFNLIANAHQAIRDEGRICLSAYRQNGSVAVTVKDSGRGIEAGALARIFEPLYSEHISDEGTGLGLYITKHLVEKNKGTIRVESTPGIGTTFHLTFKAAKP